MNTQVMALIVALAAVMGVIATAMLSTLIMGFFTWKGTDSKQQQPARASGIPAEYMRVMKTAATPITKIGPFVFARVEIGSAGRWVQSMQDEGYTGMWTQITDDALYVVMVESAQAPAMAMAPA